VLEAATEELPGAPAVLPVVPAFAPTAAEPVLDGVELALGAAAPVTPPVVLGVLLAED
jgi:hypothetical protein